MFNLLELRRLLREYNAVMDHARAGRDPQSVDRGTRTAIDAAKVDGWYNFHPDAAPKSRWR